MAVETTNQLNPPASHAADPGRRAWRVLLVSFAMFCLLLSLTCYGIWRFRFIASGSPAKPARLVLHTSRGVFIQQYGMVLQLPAQDGAALQEGDAIFVDRTLEPGTAATIELFDGTRVELWPGTTLQLHTLQRTRFNNYRQTVVLELRDGMARLHLPRRLPYQKADFHVIAVPPGGEPTEISFDVGGIYMVRLLAPSSPMTARAQWTSLPATEVTVTTGHASLKSGSRSIEIAAGQRVVVDEDNLDGPLEASWQLIRDGNFSEFTEREYNCTTGICSSNEISSTTWIVRSAAAEKGSPENGYFRITTGPIDPEQRRNGETVKAANFTRRNSNSKGFRIYIQQQIEADITPYQELVFEADVRILDQSLPKAGALGTECPITISWHYTDDHGNPRQFDYCYYARESEELSESLEEWIETERIPAYEWTHLRLNLLADIPQLRRIEELWIYANGHDYVVEVANVSLVAR
ncbi:MAG: hypothetical protein KatS3mg057_0705 [Herpetosiphonaceae bacterium]|nr:MAG: hypothetical protein KatS3mg057_0705 [Herpetosiphonaceae bacterium]